MYTGDTTALLEADRLPSRSGGRSSAPSVVEIVPPHAVDDHFHTLSGPGAVQFPEISAHDTQNPLNQSSLDISRIALNRRAHAAFELHATELEKEIVQSQPFLRLFNIPQMSIAYTTRGQHGTQSMTHSRAEHSIDVWEICSRVVERLDLDPKTKAVLRIAALIHDIGHSAFSHSGEYVIQSYMDFDHDKRGREILFSPESKVLFQNAEINPLGITPRDIGRVLKKSDGLGYLVFEICDRLAYLLKDFKGTQFNRHIKERVKKVAEALEASIVVEDKAVWIRSLPEEVSGLKNPLCWELAAERRILFQEYSLHPAAQLVNKIIERAIGRAILEGRLTIQDVLTKSDDEVAQQFTDKEQMWLGKKVASQGGTPKFVDEYFQTLCWCSLHDIKGPDNKMEVQSPRFQRQLEMTLSEILPPDSFFMSVTPDYGKSVAANMISPEGRRTRQTWRFNVPEERRFIMVTVSKDLPAELLDEALSRVTTLMRPYLGDNRARLNSGNLLENHLDNALFLDPPCAVVHSRRRQ